jgi:hypothetical protein
VPGHRICFPGGVAIPRRERWGGGDLRSSPKFSRELIFSKYLDIYHLELYRHRLSMEGTQLFYYALVGRMTASIPETFLEEHGIED